MKLLLDHNLAPRIARALNALFNGEHQIIALRDKFPPNTADVTWVDALDQDRGWAVLTRDIHLRTRPHERAALDRARIVFFFLAGSWKSFTVEETAARLIRLMPKIIAQTSLAESGRFEIADQRGLIVATAPEVSFCYARGVAGYWIVRCAGEDAICLGQTSGLVPHPRAAARFFAALFTAWTISG